MVIGFVGRAAESRQQFSTFLQNNFLGQNGRQICNACHVLQAQAAVRKRAATSSVARLEPLRRKIHRMQILRETWEAMRTSRRVATITYGVTATSLCVHVPFLPRFGNCLNCFRKHRPSTRLRKAISGVPRAPPTHTPDPAIFARLPYLRNPR